MKHSSSSLTFNENNEEVDSGTGTAQSSFFQFGFSTAEATSNSATNIDTTIEEHAHFIGNPASLDLHLLNASHYPERVNSDLEWPVAAEWNYYGNLDSSLFPFEQLYSSSHMLQLHSGEGDGERSLHKNVSPGSYLSHHEETSTSITNTMPDLYSVTQVFPVAVDLLPSDLKKPQVSKKRQTNLLKKDGRIKHVGKACTHCKKAHLACDNTRPCKRCRHLGKPDCIDVEHKRRGRPKNSGNASKLARFIDHSLVEIEISIDSDGCHGVPAAAE